MDGCRGVGGGGDGRMGGGAQTSFAPPTPEELAMTSLPGYPGAAAVVLNREEITKDDMHVGVSL